MPVSSQILTQAPIIRGYHKSKAERLRLTPAPGFVLTNEPLLSPLTPHAFRVVRRPLLR